MKNMNKNETTFRVCEQWGWVDVTVSRTVSKRGSVIITHTYLSADGLRVTKRVN